jgi:predicted nucleic acid-binding Zn ribbon protein
MVASCPICGGPLTGKQTVCSGKCRIERSRRRREAKQTERDAKLRVLLREALELLVEPPTKRR